MAYRRLFLFCTLPILLPALVPAIRSPMRALAAGTTIYVNDGPSGGDKHACTTPARPCRTIQHALAIAPDGATISIAPNSYAGNFTVSKNVTLQGAGPGTVAIVGTASTAPVITVDENVTVTLSGLTVSDGVGGGITNNGTLTVTNSAIRNNTSGSSSGGIANGGTLTVTSSTITGNIASQAGGIAAFGGTAMVTNSTIVKNSTKPSVISAGLAGGIEVLGSGSVTLANTVLAGNLSATAPDCNSSSLADGVAGHGNNFVGIGDNCGLTDGSNGDHVGTAATPLDPALDALVANGGPTLTMKPLKGSPLITAGYGPTCLATGPGAVNNLDQRGYPRRAAAQPAGRGFCDIGAYDTRTAFITPRVVRIQMQSHAMSRSD